YGRGGRGPRRRGAREAPRPLSRGGEAHAVPHREQERVVAPRVVDGDRGAADQVPAARARHRVDARLPGGDAHRVGGYAPARLGAPRRRERRRRAGEAREARRAAHGAHDVLAPGVQPRGGRRGEAGAARALVEVRPVLAAVVNGHGDEPPRAGRRGLAGGVGRARYRLGRERGRVVLDEGRVVGGQDVADARYGQQRLDDGGRDVVLAAQVGPGAHAGSRHGRRPQNGRTATPAAVSASRTAAATAGAPGPSPCTHSVSAVTVTSPPPSAGTEAPVANATARRATCSGSDITAPSIDRGASSPLAR